MTLLPTSLGVGLGQSMAWSAQVVFRFITIFNKDITVSDVIKTFSSIPRPRLNPFFKTKNKTKIFFQYQDEDQDLKNWSRDRVEARHGLKINIFFIRFFRRIQT